MREWPYNISTTPLNELLDAVKDAEWQKFRLSMKGVSTETKLQMLDTYRRTRVERDVYDRPEELRVDNYINALLRGGQLIKTDGRCVVQR